MQVPPGRATRAIPLITLLILMRIDPGTQMHEVSVREINLAFGLAILASL